MTLFPPGPISLGTMATLHLARVSAMPDGSKLARYRVKKKDDLAFTATFSGVGPSMRRRHEPVRGAAWATLDIPDDEDEIHLVVGLPRRYGMAISRAREELQPRAACVLPDSSIRALMRGILDREGQVE